MHLSLVVLRRSAVGTASRDGLAVGGSTTCRRGDGEEVFGLDTGDIADVRRGIADRSAISAAQNNVGPVGRSALPSSGK
jgi:hypothetical protein